jgi:DNA-binding response OmpR family regulator
MVSTPGVLVVDDDPEFLEMVAERLSNDGRFDVHAAESATDALETLDQRAVDCVVTDSLVLDSGKPLVRAVRDRDADMPLIYYTGKEWDDVAEDVVATGVSDYIQKGAGSLAEVARRVEVLVDQEQETTVGDAESLSIPQLDGDEGDWTAVGSFDPGDDEDTSLDVLIAESVADHLDRDVDSFSLYDGVDAEALGRLVAPRRDGAVRRGVTVRFPVAGRLVAVTSTGDIAVRQQPLD